MTTRPRLPLAPAHPYLDALAHDHQPGSTRSGRAVILADLLGVCRRVGQRIATADELAEHHADRLAARLALHPCNLWPTEWEALTEGAPTP